MATEAPHDDFRPPHPARGVHIYSTQPTIVFLTICAAARKPWLADTVVQEHLCASWQSAQAWLVGYYLLMPDHLHLFCAPRQLGFTLEKWVTFWERQFRRFHQDVNCRWQSNPFHHRLRREESYAQKWDYVRENPLRKGLVKSPEEWPYQGMINPLRW
jgi:REP element-mobilizing transposase RayT